MLDGIPFKKKKIADQQTAESWNSLVGRIEQQEKRIAVKGRRKMWMKIAAAISFLVIVAYGVNSYTNQANLIVVITEFGEQKEVNLPDGSIITLAANSTISYYDNLESAITRNVVLKGEAFFKVAPQLDKHTFQVQTKDISVEVVGTVFNVNSHRPQSIVSLLEGAVNLKSVTDASQVLKPAQTAFFNTTNNKFELIANQTDYWSKWTVQKWTFGAGIPFEEIVTRIEETLGVQVVVKSERVKNRMVSGEVSSDNQAILFESLGALLDIQFIDDGQQVVIEDL